MKCAAPASAAHPFCVLPLLLPLIVVMVALVRYFCSGCTSSGGCGPWCMHVFVESGYVYDYAARI